MPMSRFSTGTFSTLRSPMRMLPLSGKWNPAMVRSSVVLPDPDGPSRAKNPPSSKAMDTSSSATVRPKRLVTLRTSTCDISGPLRISSSAPQGT